MDVALAGNKLGNYERTSSMASRHHAIAATNGDFGLSVGYPAYGFAEDGDLKMSRTAQGANFGVAQDESEIHVGSPGRFRAQFERVSPSEVWQINRWNFGKPTAGEIAGYTPAGGAAAKPPGSSCYAQLAKSGGLMWSSDETEVVQTYSVRTAVCQKRALSPQYGATLVAMPGTAEADQLKSLTPNETVRINWTVGSWIRVLDVLGGAPLLLKDGEFRVDNCTAPLCQRNPRTGVGYTTDGKILMVVVDGRRSDSVGMTLLEFAQLFDYLGATSAMNLDGGGSSTMVLNGNIKNHPSDGSERAVTTALLILNGPDAGEPDPAPWGTFGASAAGEEPSASAEETTQTDDNVRRAAALAAARDAGSTGGMVDAVARGTFGPRLNTLPPPFLEALRLFRGRFGGGQV
jgi:hypothetical protein